MRKKIEETEENNEKTPKKRRSLKIDPKIRLERLFSD